MSQMHTDVSASMVDLWAFGADSGTYTPPGGEAVSCRVKIFTEVIIEPDGLQRPVIGQEMRAKCLKTEIAQTPIISRPGNPGGIFAMSEGPHAGESYEVAEITDEDNHFIVCAVKPYNG